MSAVESQACYEPRDGGRQIREDLLDEARSVVCGDRQRDYGDARDNFKRIAALWGAVLDLDISPADVALCLALLKVSRLAHQGGHWDSWVDLAGYAALGAEVSEVGR